MSQPTQSSAGAVVVDANILGVRILKLLRQIAGQSLNRLSHFKLHKPKLGSCVSSIINLRM